MSKMHPFAVYFKSQYDNYNKKQTNKQCKMKWTSNWRTFRKKHHRSDIFKSTR